MSPHGFLGLMTGFVLLATMSSPAATVEQGADVSSTVYPSTLPKAVASPPLQTGPEPGSATWPEDPASASDPPGSPLGEKSADTSNTNASDTVADVDADEPAQRAPAPWNNPGGATQNSSREELADSAPQVPTRDHGEMMDTRTPPSSDTPTRDAPRTQRHVSQEAAPSAGPHGSVQPDYYAEVMIAEEVVPQGGQITLSGTGFGANETVDLTILNPDRPLGQAITNSNGDFLASFTLPADAVGFVFIKPTSPSHSGVSNVYARIYPQGFPVGDFGVIRAQTNPNRIGKVVLASRIGCTVNVLLQNSAPGQYGFFVYDDGEPVVSIPVVFPASGSQLQTVSFDITRNVGTMHNGYGFSLRTPLGFAIHAITWDFEGSDRIIAQCAAGASPSASPSQSGTHSQSATPSQSSTPSASPSQSATPSQSVTPSQSSTPSASPSQSGTYSQSATPSQSSTPSASPSRSGTPSQSSAPVHHATALPSATATRLPAPATHAPSKLARTGAPVGFLALVTAGFVASGYALRRRRR